ncbi:MAG: threonine synthase [Phycisphaerales bacterium]|nr:MAG: threonine synthase [Phycisphaerales bacterium]
MDYYSTNRRAPDVSLAQALLQGQAADKGLFLPRQYPRITREDLLDLVGKSYPEIAFEILRHYTTGIFGDDVLLALCGDAYDYEVPLEHVSCRLHVMRLDQGPTASFKDFAARMMARWMSVLMEAEHGELVILTATSGDTGSAVAHAYHGVDRVHVVVLFPLKEVSDRQRKQMTTLGGNVWTIGIEGKFDDGQAMVKRAFADPDLSSIRFTSANSINIGRLLPQAVYYFYAYVRLADVAADEQVVFSVPSGNFGDMMGGVIAMHMGLPVKRFIIATNANDEVPNFIRTGAYRPIVPSRVCISNAMNVGHPSNLARLINMYGGQMDEKGALNEQPDMDRLRRDIYSVSINDEQTRATIREAYEQYGLILEPHGAVGWAGLQRYLADEVEDADPLCISLETAHPAKFPEEIEANIGVVPETPPSLEGLEQRIEDYPVISTDYHAFREMLLERFGR